MSPDLDRCVLRGLTVRAGPATLVHDVGLELVPGRVVALVGASGSGKTVTLRALLGLLDPRLQVAGGEWIVTRGKARFDPFRQGFGPLRGAFLGYLPQDARGSLDPFLRVDAQLRAASALAHAPMDPAHALRHAGFAPGDVDRVRAAFPHTLSGGEAQRVALALALARRSRFLLADEPTTGLDVHVQRQVLATLRLLADEGLGLLVVSHDLRWLGELADEVLVMAEGRVVERILRGTTPTTPTGQRLFAAARPAGAFA